MGTLDFSKIFNSKTQIDVTINFTGEFPQELLKEMKERKHELIIKDLFFTNISQMIDFKGTNGKIEAKVIRLVD